MHIGLNAAITNPSMPLRWYQAEAIQAVIDYYVRGNKGNPVVCLPTGTGKSLVQGGFMAQCLSQWPTLRFMCLTHVKELIEQNAADMLEYWPNAPIGICSAGLSQRETMQQIIFGGIATVVNIAEQFGHRDIVLVDECHLISGKDASMYAIFFAALKKINPWLKIIGVTATPYRTGQGLLTDGGLFTDIVYDMTTMTAFNLLIEQGYICPLRTKQTNVEIDVSQLRMAGGDYDKKEAAAAADIDAITKQAVREMCEQGYNKHAWLTFASSVKHAEHINTELVRCGVSSAVIHGELPKKVRKDTIDAYKHGDLRSIVNYGVLTTGFNYKPIDMISCLRATQSTGLWVQMLGRGTRPYHTKTYCLGLDFGGNTKRLGPINDPVIPTKRGKGKSAGVMPCKLCPLCGFYNHTRATTCCNCPYQFPQQPNLVSTASNDALIRDMDAVVEVFNVLYVLYTRAQFKHTNPFLRVHYHCGPKGLQKFEERVWLQNTGASKTYAVSWWKKRYGGDGSGPGREQFYSTYVPESVDEAIQLGRYLRTPHMIRVRMDKSEPEIIGYDF